ncbi:MAG: hypothetical protein II453_04010 [Alphaproteobacteria bacterium]|nr:hypothetical protein [Alphaproteobacteria bacterium]
MFIRGGLYLVNTAVIAISTSNVAVAEGIEYAKNTLAKTHWWIEACNIINDMKWKANQSQIKNKPWFIAEKYDKSIKQVIGKAIADCVANMNEFKDKNAGDCVIFARTSPKDYSPENWNAVLLYNYVNDVIKGEKGTTQQMLDDCAKRIEKHYEREGLDVKDSLIKARLDIKAYIEALDMEKKLITFAEYYKKDDLLASFSQCNEVRSYQMAMLARIDSNTERQMYSSYKLSFKYDESNGLCISSITEFLHPLRSSTNDIDWGVNWYKLVHYCSSAIVRELESIGLGWLLDDIPITEPDGKEKQKYESINEKFRQSTNSY